ncbi:acyl carrier protein [Corallincola platygyrae]|uniref:Acyl carrier protein n=1 Tax=Corallincola platygyrae TaxID=1193278 RepID=A0ABW4XGL4_9GAMM
MYTRDQIFQEVKQAMVELFELEPSEVVPEATLYDELELDSIDAVDLVVRMQAFTGEKLAPQEFRSVRTVDDVVAALQGLLGECSNA